MNNNFVLSLAMSLIPIMALSFVVLLLIYKIYIKIRSRFNITVNCWFCNQNTKVPYLNGNSWTCPSCEQYNGFDKNGDYNREIYEQLDCSRNSERFNVSQTAASVLQQSTQNGFCEECNEAQRLKVEKLSQFAPKNESHWDAEYKLYKGKLEDQYRLCSTCDRHLKKVLREKKKMVLGSKFLDFIIKGAENIKQPHLNQIHHANQEKRKLKLRYFIIAMALINLYCLTSSIPLALSKDNFIKFLGESLGHQLFLMASHFLALSKVVVSYVDVIKQHSVVNKISLFSRTLFMMMMYSMGLKVTHSSFSSLFISLCPFAFLTLSFMHNFIDRFRLTRFTALMVVWSVLAGGLVEDIWKVVTPQMSMFVTSFITLLLAYTSKLETSPKLEDTSFNSFHKIYSEEIMSDEDSISMLSQQLSGSCASMRSVRSNKRSPLRPTNPSPASMRSPFTSSTFSLHQLPHTPLSHNSSFRSFAAEETQAFGPKFAVPMATPASKCRPGLFGSNLELNCRERPPSTVFGMSASGRNSALLNNSFTETNHRTRFAHQMGENELPFFTVANNTANTSMFMKNNTIVGPSSHTGLHSPFSVSTSAVYNHQQHQNRNPYTHHKLLSPTRFSTNNLISSNASWLSGGYFNQRQPVAEVPHTGLIIPTNPAQSVSAPMNECMSRSSSHSSGFESQNGRINGNVSRENSLCSDFSTDYYHRASTTDNINSFQPIDSPSMAKFSPRPSQLTNPAPNNYTAENSGIWKQPTFAQRSNKNNLNIMRNSTDSFNLRKINEELPSLIGADTIQQWKEGQVTS